MNVINTKQELYGVWVDDDKQCGWVKGGSGTPAIFGKQQATDFCFLPTMSPKRLYLCCDEELVECKKQQKTEL